VIRGGAGSRQASTSRGQRCGTRLTGFYTFGFLQQEKEKESVWINHNGKKGRH
jgi:hypothetical protein